MNILVCLKQVPDTEVHIQLSKAETGIDTSNIEWIINPYDEFALEEALRIKESTQNTKVIALSLGPARVEKALKTALAMGADEACLIETNKPEHHSQSESTTYISQALSVVIKQKNIDLIIMGKVGIDKNHYTTGSMLAEYLQLPHVTCVTKLTQNKNNNWICERQIESEIKEEITLSLPALITVEKGINQPRYPSLMNIMKAKNKPLQKISLSSLNISDPIPSFCFDSYSLYKNTLAGEIISGTPEQQAKKLIHVLKETEKLI